MSDKRPRLSWLILLLVALSLVPLAALASDIGKPSVEILESLYEDSMYSTLGFLSDSVSVKVHNKLKEHNGFTTAFLYGFLDSSGSTCHIRKLRQDKETTLGYKKLIAEFLGVPVGTEIETLRKAYSCLPSPYHYG